MRYTKGDRIGQRREVIRIEQPTFVQNEYGEQVKSWVLVREAYARADFRTRGSDEIMIQRKKTSRSFCMFTIPADLSIDTEMRIVWRTRIYDIESISLLEGTFAGYMLMEATQAEVNAA